jgi:hypothetical protein
VAQPKVLTRFAGLPNPMAGGQGLRTYLADYLRAERDLGRLAPHADPDMAATMIIGACHEVILPVARWRQNPTSATPSTSPPTGTSGRRT